MRRLALFLPLIAVATLHASDPVLPPLSIDQGAAGAWQKILKLQTTASVLHTTAHPDDEHSGVLTLLSRGLGVRTALLTINRGEAGDNAIGPELFDALGLIRTDELARAGQYYGLDEQYFTQVADYGFSKRLDEAMTEWDRAQLVRDMVRAIRRFRPLVVVSRWQGSGRDGHGQHQAAGAIDADGSGRRGGRSAVPGTGGGAPAALARAQAVRRRRARDRGMARACRDWRVRPGARRDLRQHRAYGIEPAAFANQRTLEPDHGTGACVLHAR